MYTSFNINKQGMSAIQNKIDLISSNVANVGTAGYKKLDSEFQTLVTETLDRPSYPNNSKEAYFGTGTKLGNTYRNVSQGSIKVTDRLENFAIEGNGYFRVLREDGSYAYTRNGAFSVDGLGKIVDDSGNLLDIDFYNGLSYQNFNFANEEYTVSREGFIRIKDGTVIGQINLYKPTGDNGLNSINDNLFIPKDGELMIKSSDANLIQGCIEMSNIDIADEFKDLIIMQRAYQLNGKGIKNADEMWSLINNMQGR